MEDGNVVVGKAEVFPSAKNWRSMLFLRLLEDRSFRERRVSIVMW
jgi:hypothetical protein